MYQVTVPQTFVELAIAKCAADNAPYCGDQCGCWQHGEQRILCIADGLGHGQRAETAAKAALDYVAAHLGEPLTKIFSGCDPALRHTVGVAMSIAVVSQDGKGLTHAGIGNTEARIVGRDRHRQLSSYPGIVGGGYRKLLPETVPLGPGELVILTTDGIKGRWNMDAYGNALKADIKRLAKQILQDWARPDDDAAVMIYKNNPKGGSQ